MESYVLFKSPAIFAQDKVPTILFIPIPILFPYPQNSIKSPPAVWIVALM
jgi:hypothetical protein